MDFFYRNKPWYAGQFVRLIKPKFEIFDNIIPFFTTILNSLKKILLSVLVRNIDETFRNLIIYLPTKDKKINFEFIENFVAELEAQRVAELEAQRVAELEAYLCVTGLKNYELTEEEKNILSQLDAVKWQEYKISDLFEKISVIKALKPNVRNYKNKEFNIPVVYCKFGDNGIMYWGREDEFTTCENVISIIYNGVIAAGKVYAQKEKTGILAESYFIKLKNMEVSHNVNLFMSRCLEKVLYYKYSRDYLATWYNRVENDYIRLPTKNGEIDFEFMETSIKAIQKLVIKDVVCFADKKIAGTKKVIKNK